MSKFLTLSWEADDNPNDPSGVARFTVGNQSVAIGMNNFFQATKLYELIEQAFELEKQQLLARIDLGLSTLLHTYRHE